MSVNKKIIETEAAVPDSQSFNTVLYSGNGGTQSITGVGFKPDIVWIKPRNQVENHTLHDSTRGAINQLAPNATASARDQSNTVQSFDTDGFTTGSDNNTNKSGINYVAWCWKAGGGTTSSNTDGDITSTVQTSALSGCSIVKWTANGNAGVTVGHGLGAAPELIIMKNLDRAGYGWLVYHSAISPTSAIVLNTADAKTSGIGYFNNTAATSSVFSLGSDTFGNYNGDDYIAYCYHSVSGFSKIGSYTGDGNTNGPTVTTGFQPDWLLVKDEGTGNSWRILDSVRSTSNPRNNYLDPNTTAAEGTSIYSNVDFNSNNFQLKNLGSNYNNSGRTYLYWAIKNN